MGEAKLLSGKGGQLMRVPACLLVMRMAQLPVPLSPEQGEQLLALLRENLRHPDEDIRAAAAEAVAAFTR